MWYKGREVSVKDRKIEIRTIHDFKGEIYDIFDIMILIVNNLWVSYCTVFDLETAIKNSPDGTRIEDKRTYEL